MRCKGKWYKVREMRMFLTTGYTNIRDILVIGEGETKAKSEGGSGRKLSGETQVEQSSYPQTGLGGLTVRPEALDGLVGHSIGVAGAAVGV